MKENYGLQVYEKQENIIDLALLEQDAIPFAVLRAIVNNRCDRVFTDHRQVIICHSAHPWPVWVWFSPGAEEKTFQMAAACLKNEFPTGEGYLYNLTYEALERLKAADADLKELAVKINILCYRCDRLQEIPAASEGRGRSAQEADIPLIARWKQEIEREAEKREMDMEQCLQSVRGQVEKKALFLWENARQQPAAMASRNDDGELSKVMAVYTLPQERRKGFALHLVHQITGDILRDGKTPVLYTDADYGASNACYQKIGYRQVGRLCTAGGKQD